MLGTACFFNRFLDKKRTNREISGRLSGKDPHNRATIFLQNVIGTSYFLDGFLSRKRTKREISDQFSGKSQYNRRTIFTKRNGFLS